MVEPTQASTQADQDFETYTRSQLSTLDNKVNLLIDLFEGRRQEFAETYENRCDELEETVGKLKVRLEASEKTVNEQCNQIRVQKKHNF